MISVLYVDDEPDLLELTQQYLERTGEFRVMTSTSAQEALKSPLLPSYNAIISDYQMPGMNGITFLKRVRERFEDLPFILFTGRGREEVVIDAINNGADFYVQKGGKPAAQFADLTHKIRLAVKMRQVQMSLAEQEQRLQDLQNSNDLIQSVAPDGHFRFVNKKWLDTLGYDEHELKDLTIFDVIHEDSLEHCKEVFPRVIAGENMGIIEVVFKTREGKKVFAEGMANCKITNGQPQYTRGIFKDVTDRITTETALRESERKFRTLVEYTLDGILILDFQGKLLFANEAAGRLTGADNYREMFGKKNVLEFIAPESQADAIRDFGQVAQGIDGYLARYRIFTAQGRERWIESIGKNIRFEGAPAILLSLRDITDRKLAEDALHESEEKFRGIFDTVNDGIHIHEIAQDGKPGKFIEVNDVACRMVRYTREELLEHGPLDFVTGYHSRPLDEIIAELSTTGHSVFETEHRRKDGTIVPVEINSHVVSFQGKQVMVSVVRDITDRKQAQDALRESERKFRAIFESSPYPICINSIPDGRFIAVNQAFRQSSGYTDAEILGKSPMETGLLSIVDFGRLTSHMLVSGRLENVPMVLAGKGGNRVHVQFSTIPVTLNDRPVILSMAAEVTKLKRVEEELVQKNEELYGAFEQLTATEEELRQNYEELRKNEQMLRTSEEKFRALVEHSLDGILITDFTGNLLFANRTAGRIAEVEDYEAIAGKRNVLEFVAPASQADVIGDLNKVAQGIDTYHVQYKLITDAKREIWAECIGKKIQFGDSMAMLVSLRDITEYKRAEETMKQSEEWFRTILGSMQSGMIIIDAQTHRILDLNPKALEMIGELKESVVGSICHRFVCPAESGKCPVMDLGQTIDSSERVLLTPRGEEIPILKSVIKTTLGGREVLVESFVDITERKNVEEALRRANRQLSLLTDITRHDLLNKITVIFGNLDIAEDTCTDPAMTWYFRKMEAATRAIQSQIEFTRIYQDLGTREPQWIDLDTVMPRSHVPAPMTLNAGLKDVEVFADPMLEKVFFNLLDNSIRHGQRVTEIRVSSNRSGEDRVVVWEDNGVGVAPHDKERIFNRGFGKNTGLGLFLVREILSLTGITINETGTPASGARFEITVPAKNYRIAAKNKSIRYTEIPRALHGHTP